MSNKQKPAKGQPDNSPLEELQEKYTRALADYQNLEKRIPQDIQRRVAFEKKEIFANVLHILDNLERAQQHSQDPGVKLTIDNFIAYLKSQGVEEIESDGQLFDPHSMECIERGDDNKEIVTETFSKGYRLDNMVLRVAKVAVGTKKPPKVN